MTSEMFKIITSDGYLLVLFGDKLVRISGKLVFTSLEKLILAAKESIIFNNQNLKNPEIYETGGVEIQNNASHFGLKTGEVLTTFESMKDLITKYPEFYI